MVVSEFFGWLAAVMSLLTFYCNDMLRLRLLALSANAAFVVYGLTAVLPPVLALHLMLIPDLLRLLQLRKLLLGKERMALAVPGTVASPGTVPPVDTQVQGRRADQMQLHGLRLKFHWRRPRFDPATAMNALVGTPVGIGASMAQLDADTPGGRAIVLRVPSAHEFNNAPTTAASATTSAGDRRA